MSAIEMDIYKSACCDLYYIIQEDAWEEVSIQHESALRLAEVSQTSLAGNSRWIVLYMCT